MIGPSRLAAGLWLAILLATLAAPARAQTESPEAMGEQVERLFREGKYEQATELASQALDLAEQRYGPDHPQVGHALYRLGTLHRTRARIDDAEAAMQRSLAIFQRAHGQEHQDVAKALSGLASVRRARGDLQGVETLELRAVAVMERALGPDHPDLAIPLNNLGATYFSQGRFALAEPPWQRALAIREKALGPDHPEVAQSVFNLGIVKWMRTDYASAEALLLRATAIEERRLGAEHPALAKSLMALAAFYAQLGREAEAETLHLRALAIQERTLGALHPAAAETRINLGNLYFQQARYDRAEGEYRRAIEIYGKLDRPNPAYAATALLNLASIYLQQGRLAECEPLLARGLEMKRAHLGDEHPEIASATYNLALLRWLQGRAAEAEPPLRQVVAFFQSRQLERDPESLRAIDQLAKVLADLGRLDDAEQQARRGLELREAVFGGAHPSVAQSLVTVGDVALARGDPRTAETAFRRALAIQQAAWGDLAHADLATTRGRLAAVARSQGQRAAGLQHVRIASTIAAQRLAAAAKSSTAQDAERPRLAQILAQHVLLLSEAERDVGRAATEESFRVAQAARASDTAAQLARMATRYAAGTDRLAQRVRERQDVERRMARAEAQFLAALAAGGPTASATAAARAELAALQRTLADLDAALARDFPTYEELIDPRPLDLAEVRALLQPDEALLNYLVTDDAAFVWLVSRRTAVFRRLDGDGARLAGEVSAIRAHLDAADPSTTLRRPFPLQRAHALYRTLLGSLAGDLAGVRHLVVVPDGPLQSLPFAALVATPTADRVLGAASPPPDWLLRRHEISVLPSVSSLRALRAFAHQPPGSRPFAGFGDPILDGTPGARGTVAALRVRGGAADLAAVRQLPRLPETATELRSIAATLGAPESALYLRERATETEVKRAALDTFRTLSFATHGLLAGGLRDLSEPALVLTPPASASDADDGLLTASEIAHLKLKADWVVLSACNTAADDGKPAAEGLSGLSKAFFYAGARSLLVSHWAVDSEATVELMTTMFRIYGAGATKAAALRQASLRLMRRPGGAPYAHPMFWAPFIVVGEGGGRLEREAPPARSASAAIR